MNDYRQTYQPAPRVPVWKQVFILCALVALCAGIGAILALRG